METPEKVFSKDTFAEYLGKKDHISSSDIKNFLKSPKYYYWNKYEKTEKADERHFAIGSALHELILEPHLFKSNYLVMPKVDRRTKEGKSEYNSFVENSAGKTIIMQDEAEMIAKMAESASKNTTFMKLLEQSHREISLYTVDKKTGLKVKLRPDIMPTNMSTIVDIKSCVDSSPYKFKRDALSYGYNISAAYYTHFVERDNYVFCAIEKEQPHQTALYSLSDDSINYGSQQFRLALDLLKWCYDNNYWCEHNEFEILKECYQLENLDQFIEIAGLSEKITIL